MITLVNGLAKILSQKIENNQLNRETLNLLQSVHNVVSDMAVENSDLVETEFVINYMNSISSIRRRLDKDKTEAFIDMFRGKCQDEQVEQFVIDNLINVRLGIDVATSYDIKELESLLLRKWTDGDIVQRVTSIQHFNCCRRYIAKMSRNDAWSEE